MKVVLDISSSHRHLPSPSLAEMRLMHIGRFHSPRLVMLGAIAAIVAAVLCLALGARVQAYGPAPVRETDLLVSVKSFGAIGDGRADDRTAVIKAFRSGHAVFFPRGTYRIGATIDFGALRREEGWMQPSVVMVGEGPRLSRLVYSGRGVMLIGGRTAPSVGGYEQRLTIRDLSLTGSASSAPKPVRTLGLFRTKPNEFAGTSSEQTAVFWEFDGSSVIERDEFTNFGTAISTKAGYGFVVRNNVFRYNGIALLLEKAVTTGVIEQNLIERNDIAIGLWMASQIRITNNAIQANYGGADIVSYNWNTQIFVTENYFEASPVGFFHSGDSGGEYISNNYYFYRNKALAVKLGKLAKNFVFEGNRIQSFECSGPGSEVSLVDNYDDRKDGLVPYRAPADGGSLACLRHVPTP